MAAGKLCIAGAECREASCGQRVPDAETRRLFTFATTNATYLGALKPGVRMLSCNGYSELTVHVSAKLPKRMIARLSIGSQGDAWELKLDADQLRRPVALRLATGIYRIELEAPHFVRARGTATIGQKPAVAILNLQPAPILSATVRDRRDRNPIPGALIASDSGDSALSDTSGRFSLEPDRETWPSMLTITAPGHAPATVAVPRAHASKSFEDILLGRGGSITVDLTRAMPSDALDVELNKLQRGAMVSGPLVKSVRVAAGEHATNLTFETLEPGDYDVVIKGDGPAKRRGEVVTLQEGEVKHVSIDLIPFRLNIRTRFKGEPLPASIRLRNMEGRWEGQLETDSEGETTTELWQGGETAITLGAPGVFTAPYFERRKLPDGDDAEWIVEVPGHEITGIVVDAATGEPIPEARVILTTRSLASRTKSGADGRFRYAPAAYGSHTLTAHAKGYLPTEMTYAFTEPETRRELTVRMERASSARVAVVDSRGAPVGGARLVVFRGLEFLVFGITDESGVGEVPRPVDQPYDVYAIPRDGSFGVAQVMPDAERTTIRMPDGVSRIVLKSESESHQPIPRVVFLMRHNGRLLPEVVLKTIGDLQGVRMWTGADGVLALERMPTGLYEFWPATAAADAPARVIVAPGENIATMTFAPAH